MLSAEAFVAQSYLLAQALVTLRLLCSGTRGLMAAFGVFFISVFTAWLFGQKSS